VEGISIGISVSGRVFERDEPIPWRWALQNNTDEVKQVTVEYSLDTAFRHRLQVFIPGGAEPVTEFTPDPSATATTFNSNTTLTAPPRSIVELPPKEALVGSRLGAGIYQLRVLFGGKDFSFSCASGNVEIQVK